MKATLESTNRKSQARGLMKIKSSNSMLHNKQKKCDGLMVDPSGYIHQIRNIPNYNWCIKHHLTYTIQHKHIYI